MSLNDMFVRLERVLVDFPIIYCWQYVDAINRLSLNISFVHLSTIYSTSSSEISINLKPTPNAIITPIRRPQNPPNSQGLIPQLILPNLYPPIRLNRPNIPIPPSSPIDMFLPINKPRKRPQNRPLRNTLLTLRKGAPIPEKPKRHISRMSHPPLRPQHLIRTLSPKLDAIAIEEMVCAGRGQGMD